MEQVVEGTDQTVQCPGTARGDGKIATCAHPDSWRLRFEDMGSAALH